MLYNIILLFLLVTPSAIIVKAQSAAKKMVLNTVVDKLINRLTVKMKASGNNFVQIPDVNYEDIGAVLSQGLTAKDGTFGDLSTLRRAGDVSLTVLENTITVQMAVGISSAVVHFRDFQAWYGAIVLADELSVYINQNSVDLQLTLTVYEDSFRVNLDRLSIKEFGDIILERKRDGILKNVSNSFLSWIISWFQDKIQSSIEQSMRDAIQKQLVKHKLV